MLRTDEVPFDRFLDIIDEGVGLESDNGVLYGQNTVTVFHI